MTLIVSSPLIVATVERILLSLNRGAGGAFTRRGRERRRGRRREKGRERRRERRIERRREIYWSASYMGGLFCSRDVQNQGSYVEEPFKNTALFQKKT